MRTLTTLLAERTALEATLEAAERQWQATQDAHDFVAMHRARTAVNAWIDANDDAMHAAATRATVAE